MREQHTYCVEVEGYADEAALNAAGPIGMKVEYADQSITRLSIRTDQSGAVGFIRYLHGRGFLLIAVNRMPGITLPEREEKNK